MMNASLDGECVDPTIILTASSALSAILHTLIPDHEIPSAMIGRSKLDTEENGGCQSDCGSNSHFSIKRKAHNTITKRRPLFARARSLRRILRRVPMDRY